MLHLYPKQTTRFILLHGVLLSLSFVLIYLFLPVGGAIDLSLISPYINQHGDFFLRSDWALTKINHDAVKYVLIMVYATLLIQWIQAYQRRLHEQSWQYGYFFIMAMCSTIFIGFLKSHAAHACPWDMISLSLNHWNWDFSATHGHCFPGGHASTGFALMVGYFVYHDINKRRAYFFLFSAMILGFAMGWAQMMRGAHFFSHNIWTAWIIWAMNLLGYILFKPKLKNLDNKVQNNDHYAHE